MNRVGLLIGFDELPVACLDIVVAWVRPICPDYPLRADWCDFALFGAQFASFIKVTYFEAMLRQQKLEPLLIVLILLRCRVEYLQWVLLAVFLGAILQYTLLVGTNRQPNVKIVVHNKALLLIIPPIQHNYFVDQLGLHKWFEEDLGVHIIVIVVSEIVGELDQVCGWFGDFAKIIIDCTLLPFNKHIRYFFEAFLYFSLFKFPICLVNVVFELDDGSDNPVEIFGLELAGKFIDCLHQLCLLVVQFYRKLLYTLAIFICWIY